MFEFLINNIEKSVWLIYISVSLFGALSVKYGLSRYLKKKLHIDNKSSLLFALYTMGRQVAGTSNGTVDGMHYRTFMTTPFKIEDVTPVFDSGAIIYMFELDFNSQAHIIGLGDEAHVDKLQLKSYFNTYHLEKVSLEGNYNKHFNIYAGLNQQTQVRYILDPKAMESFIDFCNYNFWEIVGDEMYIVISGSHSKATAVLETAKKLIDEIRPAVTRVAPGEEPVTHEAPYGVYRGAKLNCPICNSEMHQEDNSHFCLSGHGLLIYGKGLLQLRRGQLEITIPNPKHVDHEEIICPNCKITMESAGYSGSKIEIDTCPKCHYRWVDAHELEFISKSKTARLFTKQNWN